tara:strand:+ start:1184 stop:2056 length:873 start_codon:yes stop_codon:yes gene_type:complete
MEEPNGAILQYEIKSYFEKMSYHEKYNVDIWFTILAILFVVYFMIYLYIKSSVNLEKINWEKNKCNPFYMPLAGSINNHGDGYTKQNLINCLNDLTSNIAHDILTPINATFNIFNQMFASLASLFTDFQSFIMILYNMLVSLFRELMLRLQKIIQENGIIFAKINNFTESLLGFITVLYYQIIIIVDSFKLIFPMIGMSFLIGVILPTLIAVATTAIYLTVTTFIAVTMSPIFCIGCWAWAPVIAMIPIFIFLVMYLIFIFILYGIFMQATSDILERTLAPLKEDNPEYK